MTFFQFLYKQFVDSEFLSSLHFSHLVHTSNLSVSKVHCSSMDYTSWNSPEPFMQFTLSCNPCTCEASLCIVSCLSLDFCTESSLTRSSGALFISPISCILLIRVSRSASSFIDHSACGRTCSLQDSTYPWWGVLQFQSLSTSLLLKLTNASVKRFHFVFLLHEFRSRFSKQMISVSSKKRFRNIRRVRESDEMFLAPQNLLMSIRKFVSIGKCVLIQPTLTWKYGESFPVPAGFGSWDELDIKLLSFRVINLWSFCTCFSQSTKLFVIEVRFRVCRDAFHWVIGRGYDRLVERQGSDT